jgi:hypothetical protein
MQVFVHFAVFERVEGGFLERRVGGGEVREEGCEALADFEGVCHFGVASMGVVFGVYCARIDYSRLSYGKASVV